MSPVNLCVVMLASAALSTAASAARAGAGTAPAQASEDRHQGEVGGDLFRGYCAPCHGPKGVGDGPVASSLRTMPTDLTRLARANKGAFPAQRVAMVVQFGVSVGAHGSTDMPTWGPTFRAMGDERDAQERLSALTRYLETLQIK